MQLSLNSSSPGYVCKIKLQAVQGDPVLSRLPSLCRWKCCEAKGLNLAAIYSPSEEAQDAGSGWEAERPAASQMTDTQQEQNTQAKVCQCYKPTCPWGGTVNESQREMLLSVEACGAGSSRTLIKALKDLCACKRSIICHVCKYNQKNGPKQLKVLHSENVSCDFYALKLVICCRMDHSNN